MKLHSLLIKATGSTGKGPKLVKLFTNRPSLGFSEAQDDPPVQQFELEESSLEEGATLTLKYAPCCCTKAFACIQRPLRCCWACTDMRLRVLQHLCSYQDTRRDAYVLQIQSLVHARAVAVSLLCSHALHKWMSYEWMRYASMPCELVPMHNAYMCRYVKFQSVTKLSIFIESNQGDEETTVLQKIAIFGSSGERMNVADIKDASKQQEG